MHKLRIPSGWNQCNHQCSQREKGRSVGVGEGDVRRDVLADRELYLRNVGGFYTLEKSGKGFSSRAPRREAAWPNLDFSHIKPTVDLSPAQE